VAGETVIDGDAGAVPVLDTPTVNCGLAGSLLADSPADHPRDGGP